MPIPMPAKPSGVFYGSKNSNVQIDIFIDIQCPHSKKAWPNIKTLMNHYDQNEIGLKLHLITLSNHRQSWDITKAIFAMCSDDSEIIECIDFYYQRQASFLNAPFLHKTHQDLIDYISLSAFEFNGMDKNDLFNKMNSNEIYEIARTPNRYAAVRGAWGTPTYFINNARQFDINHASDLSAWRNIIDKLI